MSLWKNKKHGFHPSFWFIVFAFDSNQNPQRIGNTVTPLRPFDWLIETNKEAKQHVRIIGFWEIDKARYAQLKDILS
jgi:hypothetical protein